MYNDELGDLRQKLDINALPWTPTLLSAIKTKGFFFW